MRSHQTLSDIAPAGFSTRVPRKAEVRVGVGGVTLVSFDGHPFDYHVTPGGTQVHLGVDGTMAAVTLTIPVEILNVVDRSSADGSDEQDAATPLGGRFSITRDRKTGAVEMTEGR